MRGRNHVSSVNKEDKREEGSAKKTIVQNPVIARYITVYSN